MRGEIQTANTWVAGLPQAVAVMDLALSGVYAEFSDDIFNWYEVPAAAPVKAAAAPAPVDAPMPVVSEGPVRMAPPLEVSLPPVREAAPVRAMPAPVEEKAEVWSGGEAGGVVLVVQGAMPDSRCVQLARAMLAAVGLDALALGWVGFSGKPTADELKAAMRGLAPAQVLVLGQAPLGALVGRNLGVEGWHAAAEKHFDGWDGVVGVTYPLDLLMKQSLFKRLAWQHLLAWQDAMTMNQH
jgi:hypothetical protein